MGIELGIQDDDYEKQVLACYDSRHRFLVKIYTLFIVVGLGFLAFILVPLLGLKLDAVRLPQELADQEKSLESMRPILLELQKNKAQSQDELQKLNQELAELGSLSSVQLQETKSEKNKTVTMLNAIDRIEPDKYPNLQDAVKRVYEKNLKKVQELERKYSQLSVEENDLNGNLEGAEDELKKIEMLQKQIAFRADSLSKHATGIETNLKVLKEDFTNTQTEMKRVLEAVALRELRLVDIRNRLSKSPAPAVRVSPDRISIPKVSRNHYSPATRIGGSSMAGSS